jgi:hypothetical protein
MTDIFFSYSSKDRDRVHAVHRALAAQGFDVFWDQSVPPGMDWDTWIRQHLNEAKCAIAFWSTNSVGSDNVRHEATVAKQRGKLVPVLLDSLTADQFPMGLYAVQGANLTAWAGDEEDDNWLKLRHEVESKLNPPWVRRQIDKLEAELVAERARREGAERRDRILREQIAKEAQAQQELSRERDGALEKLAAVTARLESAQHDKLECERRIQEQLQQISQLESDRQVVALERETGRHTLTSESKASDTSESEASEGIGPSAGTLGDAQETGGTVSKSTMSAQPEALALLVGALALLLIFFTIFLFSSH